MALSSSDTNIATVPANATIASGQSTGTFTITGVPVTEDGVVTITATLGSDVHTADVTVTRPIGTLTGTVKDVSTGFTLPNAHVVLTSDPAIETWTDGNGSVQLLDIAAGIHTVDVSYENYSSATSGPVTVVNGQTATIPPVSLTPGMATVFGTVVDPDNGNQPVSGVLVTEVTGLHTLYRQAGTYAVALSKPGYVSS